MCQTPCVVVICGRWFWTKFHLSRAFSWLCPTLQGLRWMKVCKNKDLRVNEHRCRLPTCPSICQLPCVLPTEPALRMKSSHWTGLLKWQELMKQHLPCCTICPRAFTPWHLHLISSKDFVMLDYRQACKVWLLVSLSIRAWTTWHGQQAFKAWLWEISSIRTWTMCHGQQACKVWLSVISSIRAWTMWHGQQAFKAWLLVRLSIRAWTMWHGQHAFKAWH